VQAIKNVHLIFVHQDIVVAPHAQLHVILVHQEHVAMFLLVKIQTVNVLTKELLVVVPMEIVMVLEPVLSIPVELFVLLKVVLDKH